MFIVSFTMVFKNMLIVDEVLLFAQNANLPAEALAYIQEYNWGEARLLDTTGELASVIVAEERKAFQLIAIEMAILGTILLVYSFYSTKERIKPPAGQESNLMEDVKNVFGVRAWFILFVLGIITFVLITFKER
jgi:hypothetical protein